MTEKCVPCPFGSCPTDSPTLVSLIYLYFSKSYALWSYDWFGTSFAHLCFLRACPTSSGKDRKVCQTLSEMVYWFGIL